VSVKFLLTWLWVKKKSCHTVLHFTTLLDIERRNFVIILPKGKDNPTNRLTKQPLQFEQPSSGIVDRFRYVKARSIFRFLNSPLFLMTGSTHNRATASSFNDSSAVLQSMHHMLQLMIEPWTI
jgi:hypothetical protein